MTSSSSTTTVRASRRPRTGDWVLALAFLGVFAVGYLAARDWPLRAALFPQLVSATGFILTVLRLLAFTVQAARSRHDVREATSVVDDHERGIELVDDEAEADESIEYVFATAGPRAWAAALGWIVAFFASLWVLGVFVTVPLFALLYLRFAGRTSWVAAALYAGVTGGLIYLVFQELLVLPMPDGIF